MARRQRSKHGSEFLELWEICEQIHVSKHALIAQCRRKEFPDILYPARGVYLVRRRDFEDWLAGRWIGVQAELADVIREECR